MVCHWLPSVEFLPENVRFVSKKDLSTFNLSQIEKHLWHFFTRTTDLVAVCILAQEFAEPLRFVNYALEQVLFFRLEWQLVQLIQPILKIFKLGSRCISRNLDTPVANGTCEFLSLLDFATCEFQALRMVPIMVLADLRNVEGTQFTSHDIYRTRS